MDDYEYYGLFLTQESRDKLNNWFWHNDYGLNDDIVKKGADKWYLDHVTLLHSSKAQDYTDLERRLEAHIWMNSKNCDPIMFEVNGIGESHNTLAFRCNIMPYFCASKVPHITICTFRGGVPKDSNDITEWKDIKPIIVKGVLKKV